MQCNKRIFVAPMHRELEFIVPLTEFYITCPKCNQEVDSAIYDEHMQGHEDQASNTEEGTSNPSPRPGPSSGLEEATSLHLEWDEEQYAQADNAQCSSEYFLLLHCICIYSENNVFEF